MSTNDKIEDLFKNQDNWDFETPNQGHEKRFLDKLKNKVICQQKRIFGIMIISLLMELKILGHLEF